MEKKPVLIGLLPGELKKLLPSYPPFRSAQICKWICSGAASFDEMSNLPLSLRRELSENYSLVSCTRASELRGPDGTVKLGIALEDGTVIEAVILSDGAGRKTACLSTQAGCQAGCVFCKTGKLGFRRNLSAAEIAGQFLYLRKKDPALSHIVLMGMGEPLLNMEELFKAVAFLTDKDGLNISKRRITVSTCGVVEGIRDLAEKGPDIRFALSPNTARQELRDRLMPLSRENPLPLLKDALRHYQKTRRRRITLEMVLLGGVNTGTVDAEAAADFIEDLDAVFNIIPWNPVEGLEFEGRPLQAPAPRETREYAACLENRGCKVTRRTEKGQSISGACGQLGTALNGY
jgi:23S rRNA (adenine2503-C2)-methyltransferase